MDASWLLAKDWATNRPADPVRRPDMPGPLCERSQMAEPETSLTSAPAHLTPPLAASNFCYRYSLMITGHRRRAR
ncbi:hypothetical protein GCM10010431_38340 [Streptomyces kunmingensis]